MWLPPPPTRGIRRLTLSSEGVAYIHDTIRGQKLTLKATPFLCLAETLMRVYDTPAGQGSPNLRLKEEEGRRFGCVREGGRTQRTARTTRTEGTEGTIGADFGEGVALLAEQPERPARENYPVVLFRSFSSRSRRLSIAA